MPTCSWFRQAWHDLRWVPEGCRRGARRHCGRVDASCRPGHAGKVRSYIDATGTSFARAGEPAWKERTVKLGISINDYAWAGGAAQLGPLVGDIARAADE